MESGGRLRSQRRDTLNVMMEDDEPKSVHQALNGPNAEKWKDAIDLEYQALLSNKTWEVVEKPEGVAIHKPIWKFKIKDDGRFKARLCFDRRFQELGVDYFDTYAPVMRMEMLRTVVNATLQNGGVLRHLDIPNAFLNAEVDANVYMYEPEGFSSGRVLKLKRSLYGLKQAPRLWFTDLKLHFAMCWNLYPGSSD